MKKLALIIFFASNSPLIFGQAFYFRNYQVDNGVSSNFITCIAQDKKGFMWFGTRNGLNRFDGVSFMIFRNDLNNPLSIGSNSILSLFEDKQERLWVGTYKGIYIYNARSETFSAFHKIPAGEVRFIMSDRDDYIWVVANYVLYKINPGNNEIQSFNFPGTQVIAIARGNNGYIWCATSNGMLKKYDHSRKAFDDYNIAALYKGKDSAFIQTISPVSDSTILIATLNQALLFNTFRMKLTNVFSGRPWANNIQVHKIVRQSGSEFWFGTESGLYIHDFARNKSERIQKQYGNPFSISDNVITDFYKDKEGDTWIGTFFGGINYYSGQLNQFQRYFPMPGLNSLSGNLVHTICKDRNNNLWVGTEDGGLNKIDSKTGIIRHFMPGQGKGSISYQNIHGLLAAGNELWIGTYEHGLDVMDLRTEKVIRHYEKSNRPNSLGSNFIVTLYKRRNGEILVGTWAGLYKYNPDRDNFSILPYFNRQAQAIHEDEEGNLWVCTYGSGVYFHNNKTGIGGHFKYYPKDIHSIPNDYVNNLFGRQ